MVSKARNWAKQGRIRYGQSQAEHLRQIVHCRGGSRLEARQRVGAYTAEERKALNTWRPQ